ncbi:MAG: ferritin-like domain-containing protein [Chloroflexota bacterium]|nr:ferritin-like domain-containing protein [Chloroflexota bacterium]
MLQTNLLRSWLADAYGAEVALVDVMETQLADLSSQHEMEAKFFEYLDMLQRHANMLQDRITDLEGETNALNKGGMTSFINTMKDLWVRPINSRLVKHDIVDGASIHYQIAQVNALRVAAHSSGHAEVTRTCEDILRDKREMVQWLDDYLPTLVHQLTNTEDGGEDTSEDEHSKVGNDGTLQKRHLYAVVDEERQAREVTQALKNAGVDVDVLKGRREAETLTKEAQGPTSLVQKTTRFMKNATGEKQQATHYATQVENGRIVLAMSCPDRVTADTLVAIIKEHGGYDMTYVGEGTMESISE